METSPLENLEDEKEAVTLRCKVDSNPPAAILWRKEGLNGVFSPEEEIVFSPVTKHTAGLYSCTAENQLGMSKPDYVELNVKCKHSSCFRYISMILVCIMRMHSTMPVFLRSRSYFSFQFSKITDGRT